MQLGIREAAVLNDLLNLLPLTIDKDADTVHKRGQIANDLPYQFGLNIPRALINKDKAQGINSCPYALQSIFEIGDAAHLDPRPFNHEFSLDYEKLRRNQTTQSSQGVATRSTTHQTLTDQGGSHPCLLQSLHISPGFKPGF